MMKNNKKGFTLVELLAVIVVLAIIITIAVPGTITVSNKIKKRMYNTKVDMILKSAALYGQDYSSKISSGNENCYLVSVQTLIDNGYIKKDENNDVINPIDNTSMNELQVCLYKKSGSRVESKTYSTTKNAWPNTKKEELQKLYIFKNGNVTNYNLVDGSYNETHYFNIGNTITYNAFKNSYLYCSTPISNNYKTLNVKIKATGYSNYDWARVRIGIRPKIGSDGSSNYNNYFIPGDWLKMVEAATYTTKDSDYRTVTLDLSNISNSEYYFYMHTAGINFSITEIWFE